MTVSIYFNEHIRVWYTKIKINKIVYSVYYLYLLQIQKKPTFKGNKANKRNNDNIINAGLFRFLSCFLRFYLYIIIFKIMQFIFKIFHKRQLFQIKNIN